jgi:deoxyribonuclease-4
MKYIGAHVSIAGGLENASINAAQLNATGFALFTRNQRQWQAPPVTAEAAETFRRQCAADGFSADAVLPHDSYLINLGNPDADKRKRATAAFTAEMTRVEALGLKLLNFHPGSGLGVTSKEETIRNIADSVKIALAETESAVAVFENTAGQGSLCGCTLEELQMLLEFTGCPERCGVCIDTCHAFAAGIDLASPDGYDAFWSEFQSRIGFQFLRGMHLNDAKAPCGSHLDRHAPLGAGTMGWELFLKLAADPRIDGIPMILETPEPELWPEEIRRLREAAEQGA